MFEFRQSHSLTAVSVKNTIFSGSRSVPYTVPVAERYIFVYSPSVLRI